MRKCKSKGPTNDMPIDMVKAVLQRLFTLGHGPPSPIMRAAKRQRPKKKEILASASPSAKAMSSMPPEE